MAKTLHADGNTGKVYIYNSGADPALYATPTASQLADLHFHSDLSYLGNTQVLEVTITHPQRTRSSSTSKGLFGSSTYYNPVQGSQGYTLGVNQLGAPRPFVAFYQGVQMPSGTVVQQVGQSVRAVSVSINASNISLFENFVTFDDTLPAVNRTYRVFLFQTLFTGAGNVSIQAQPGLFRAGFGKLSTDYRYLRRNTVTPDFYVGAGKTADVQGGGLKVVLADNSVPVQSSTYTGAFTGTGGTGVQI